MKLDLGNPTNIREAAKKFEMVVGALPSWLGYNALKAVLEAGKNYVDISFMEVSWFHGIFCKYSVSKTSLN